MRFNVRLLKAGMYEFRIAGICGRMERFGAIWSARLEKEGRSSIVLESRSFRQLRLEVETALDSMVPQELAEALRVLEKAPCLKAVRVSSAKARGHAKNYAYWGAARYRIQWSDRRKWPCAVPVSGAGSDRRSLRLAYQDALELAARERRFLVSSIGALSQDEVIRLARAWQEKKVGDTVRYS